ncbi:MAG: SHOCT domain-containing protein [Ruminococcaceae bacterium]|nr:SHOCT domain-containing protein [Oscillospiraceae bacterium]
MYYAPTPGAYPQNPSASNYSSPNTYNNPNYSPNPIGYRPAAVGWHCTCGRFHAPSESSCICGQTKYSIAAKKAAAEESPNKQSQPNNPNGETEAQKIAILKQYKDLLDNGTITQEEFEAKKKQLLGL